MRSVPCFMKIDCAGCAGLIPTPFEVMMALVALRDLTYAAQHARNQVSRGLRRSPTSDTHLSTLNSSAANLSTAVKGASSGTDTMR